MRSRERQSFFFFYTPARCLLRAVLCYNGEREHVRRGEVEHYRYVAPRLLPQRERGCLIATRDAAR